MEAHQTADKEYDLWILLNRVYHMIAKLRKLESLRFKILPTQSYFLFIIKALGNETTPTELSRYVYQERSSVSDILNRMEKQGLILKTKKSGEKKRVIVTITEKGEESLRLSRNREYLHRVMSSLTDEERQLGLMFRERINWDQGMLLVFKREGIYNIWMKNMRFPIDILWLGREKRIIHLETDVPACQNDPCPSYSPSDTALFVLELKAGSVDKHQLKINDKVEFILPKIEQD